MVTKRGKERLFDSTSNLEIISSKDIARKSGDKNKSKDDIVIIKQEEKDDFVDR